MCGRCIQTLRSGDLNWPAVSPDLTPCDFLSWVYLKAKVCNHHSSIHEKLMAAIREGIVAIQPNLLEGVKENWRIECSKLHIVSVDNKLLAGILLPVVVYYSLRTEETNDFLK